MVFSRFKNWIKLYLQLGIVKHKDHEINQQIFVSNLFSLIGYTITFAMALSAAIRGNTILAISLFSASLLFFISHQIHRIGNLQNSHKISARIVLFSLLTLMLYLVYTGGHANTGPLWMYIVPPVAFFFGGLRKGLRSLGLFIVIVGTMLFYPDDALLNAEYSFEFKSRLIYSFLTVTLLFGFYEYSRQKSFKSIQDLSDKFERQAMLDPLTHLPNRRAMRDYLEHEYARAQRSKLDMSVLLCDIDHFKQINDKYGHDGGDFVLQKLADLFENTLRKQDKISRWGGEEFLFLLPETSGFEAYTLAEKIRTKVAETEFVYANQSIRITLSLGVKEVSPESPIDKAINLADHFLYQAKENGRNRTMPDKETLGAG